MEQFAFDWYERTPLQQRPLRPRKPQPDRLYFAALLGDQAAAVARLAAGWCRELGLTGTLMPPDRMHMPLWSIGDDSSLFADGIERACSVAAGIDLQPVTVVFDSVVSLDRVGGKRPFVLRAREQGAELQQWRSAIGKAMAATLPARPRERPELEPQVTLLRDSRAIEEHIVEPVRVTVRDLALLRIRAGRGRIEIVGRWPAG